MPHPTFFSWHHELDHLRSSVVCSTPHLEDAHKTWISAPAWQMVTPAGEAATEALILSGLKHTAVTAVLIGPETAGRRWVQHEIDSSLKRGNGLFGIYLHNIEDEFGNTVPKGANPLPPGCPTYDWVLEDGFSNLSHWVDAAYFAP